MNHTDINVLGVKHTDITVLGVKHTDVTVLGVNHTDITVLGVKHTDITDWVKNTTLLTYLPFSYRFARSIQIVRF